MTAGVKGYEVYICTLDKDVLYIGSGRINRHKHCNSGTSHVYGLNKLHFEGNIFDVNLKFFLTKEESLEEEKRLINQHRFTCAAEDSGFIFKDVLTWNKGKAPFRAQKVSNIYAQRGLDIDYEGDWRLGNLSPYCEPIVYMFKPYKVGTTVTDQFIENKLGCFNADILTKNLIEITSLSKNVNHPTEKPVTLMETLIQLVTNEGATVLDPFLGSGTTGVAALNTNRKFIGVEAEEKYFDIGASRMEGV